MYCRNCGKEIDENAFICVHCGSLVNGGRVKTFRRHSNAIGIASIIAGILALALSLSCFFKDISSVGMYTNFYERFNYTIGFILIPFIFMIVSLVLSLKKKNNTCNKIGLGLALASAFLIITEIMVIIIY